MSTVMPMLRDKVFYSRMLRLALPISAQSLITFSLTLVDTVMVGQFGEVALSATSLSSSFLMIYTCICMGVGCGAGVLTSQFWGKREIDPIRQMTAICFKLTAAAGMLFSLIAVVFPAQILSIYTADAAVIATGAKFLRVLGFSFLINGLSIAATQILRSVNKVNVPLYASIVAVAVNIFFNWVFIFGNLGAPRLEVVGSAFGTLIARVVEFGIIFGYIFFKDKLIAFRLKHLKGFNRKIFSKYIKAGLPVLCSDLIMVMGTQLTTIIIGHVGADFVAANSIANVVNNAAFSLFFGVSNASLVMTGNIIGEGKYKLAFGYGLGYLIIAFCFGLIGGGLLFGIKAPIIGIYDVTDITKTYASQLLVVMAVIMPFQLADHVFTKGVLRGGGDTKFLLLADTIFTYIFSAPLGYIAAFVLNWPCWAIYCMLKTDLIGKLILCSWRFFSKRWIKNITVAGDNIALIATEAI